MRPLIGPARCVVRRRERRSCHLAQPRESAVADKMQIAVQLYTVRDLAAKDFAGTMKQVAEIGYKYVELAGYGSAKDAKGSKAALDAAGLKPISGHYGIDLLSKQIQQVSDDAELLGMDMVVCPFLPEDLRKDAKGYENVAKILNEAGNFLH